MADFYNTYLPYAQDASQRTGLDPRLILAQAALESGWGKHAPGNNMFGIKSHGQAGGNALSTTEYGPNGPYRTTDSFRAYDSPGDSFNGYADFMLSNPRYKDMRGAQGLDAQLSALGKSGYATDPDYLNSVRQIAQGFPGGDGVSAINSAAGINPGGQTMPKGALSFAGADQGSGSDQGEGALSQKQDASNPGVLFQGEGPNKLQSLGGMMTNVAASLASINNPAQANALRAQAKGIEDQAHGKFQYQMGPNGQLLRINKDNNQVDSVAIPDAQKEDKWTPIMGKDGAGNPVLQGSYNPRTTEYKPVGGSNKTAAVGTFGVPVTETNPLGLPDNIDDLKSAGKAGEALANQVEGVYRGDIAYPVGGSRMTPDQRQLKAALGLYHPDMNSNDFNTRKKFRETIANTTGNARGAQYASLNHSYDLLSQAADNVERLGNSDNILPVGVQQLYNSAKNQQNAPDRSGAAKNIDTSLIPALMGEQGKLYYGTTGGGQEERRQISKALVSNDTVTNQIEGLKTIRDQLVARQHVLEGEADKAYGKGAEAFYPVDKAGQASLEKLNATIARLEDKHSGRKPAANTAAPAAAAPPIPSGWKVY